MTTSIATALVGLTTVSNPLSVTVSAAVDTFPEMEFLLRQWAVVNTLNPGEISALSMQKIVWEHDNHVWIQSVSTRAIQGDMCPVCTGDMRAATRQQVRLLVAQKKREDFVSLGTAHPELVPLWSAVNEKSINEVSSRTVTHFWWKCAVGHEFLTPASVIVKRGHACVKCNRAEAKNSK